MYGSFFSWADYQNRRLQVIETFENERPRILNPAERKKKVGGTKEVIHPYLGYVIGSDRDECSDYGYCDWRIVGAKTAPVTPKSEDDFVVGVFGGSFAYGASTHSTRQLLEDELKKIPRLKDKQIVIHTIALGGYKQPQQLMALNYFLMLGVQFDVVVNIDGFNEVALATLENAPRGVFPYFPRMWFERVSRVSDVDALTLVGRIVGYKDEQARLSRKLSNSLLRFSVIANLVWEYYDKRYLRKQRLAEIDYAQYELTRTQNISYTASGPSFEYSMKSEMYQDFARIWRRSSLQMAALSRGLGILYLHFLQPNQYVKDSKPMTPEEQKIALLESHPYKSGVEQGYPHLIESGEWLKQKGVGFHDLTMMFVNNRDLLYFDACCHLNEKGYNLIVEKIVEEIHGAM